MSVVCCNYIVRKLDHHQQRYRSKSTLVGQASQNDKCINIDSEGYCCHGEVVQSLDYLLLCVHSHLFTN